MNDNITTDMLLGERVTLNQARRGYRVAIDPVLLAASVPATAGEHVLDMGCGSGAASLCLAARVSGVTIDGLELMPQMRELAVLNTQANDQQNRIKIIDGNVAHPPAEIIARPYDHVMSNPPYLSAGSGNPPPDPVKAAAMVEGEAGLDRWISLAGQVLKTKGTLTLVHRADRLEDILGCLKKQFGGVVVYPLWPDMERVQPAKRVLIRAIKGIKTPLSILPGLALHKSDGTYSPNAAAILSDAKALNITS